jgi:hypothetical protein
MPDARLIQTNFSSGEISPDIKGRIDHQKYRNGAEVLCNFISSPTGGAYKRGGTHACARIDLEDATSGNYNWEADAGGVKGARLIPFVVDNDNAYALLFISVASGGCEILIVENYYDVSSASSYSRPLKRLMLNGGNVVKGTYSSGVVFPYTRDQISGIHYTQIEDTMYLTHPLHPPIKITRNGSSSPYTFDGEDVVFTDGPYQNLQTQYDGSDIINVIVSPTIDYTFVKFSDHSADGLSSIVANDWLEYQNGVGETVIGKVLAINDTDSTANGIPPRSLKVTAQDNVLKDLDTGATVESNSADITSLGATTVIANGDYTTPSGYLLSNSAIFAKSHEGYYYKHSQWSPWGKTISKNGTAAASTDLITSSSHGLVANDLIRFTTVVAGLSTATNYYVIASGLTTNAFKVSATEGGSAVNITADGSVVVIKQTSELTNRWVRIKEYLGVRTTKPPQTDSANDTNPILRTWSASKSLHSGGVLHDNIPTAGIEADIVSLVHGKWRPEFSSKTFHFENTSPTGQVYEIRRDIYGYVEANSAIFHTTNDIGRHIRFDFNGEKVWGILQKHTANSVGNTDLPTYLIGTSGFSSANTTSKFLVKIEVPMPIAQDGSWITLDSLYGNYLNEGRTNLYQLGAWYSGSAPSYPKTVAFYQDRLVFGGSPNDPQSLWFSKPTEYETFSPTDLSGSVLSSSGIAYEMVATSNNDILWLNSGESLLIGTSGSEFKVSPSDASIGLTPTSIRASRQSSYGSADTGSIKIGDSVVYIQSQGKTIREMSYNYDTDSFRSLDISIIAKHLFGGSRSISEMASIKYPHNLLFFRNSLGEITCMAYEKEQNVFASSRIALSGVGVSHSASTDWAASTTYYTGQSGSHVAYEDNSYICVKSHTSSSSFLSDLHAGYWEPSGATVISMCGMPSSNERETDSLLMVTERVPVYYNASHVQQTYTETNVTPYLSLEYMYPYGLSDCDSGKATFRRMTPDGTGDHYMDLNFGTGYPEDDGTYAVPAVGGVLSEFVLEPDIYVNLPYPTKIGGSAKLPASNYLKVAAVVYVPQENKIESYPNDTHYAAIVNDSGTLKLKVRLKSDNSDQNLISGVSSGKRIYCVVGFNFPSILRTLPIETGGDGGTSSGRFKRINEYALKLLFSGPFRSGLSNIDTFDEGYFYDGDAVITADNEYDELQSLVISSEDPSPLKILSLSTELTINR